MPTSAKKCASCKMPLTAKSMCSCSKTKCKYCCKCAPAKKSCKKCK